MKYLNVLGVIAVLLTLSGAAFAQPVMVNPLLDVRTVVTGLVTPTSMAFLGPNDILVLEKNTGRVRRVVNGVIQAAVLNLPVNSASERGLLGIARHPNFPANRGIYLYRTMSTTGADSSGLAQTPLLGNGVDRYIWNGTRLIFDRNIIRLRSLQTAFPFPNGAGAEGSAGNHNGGVITFGPDGKLYIVIGDNGRRGRMQNLRLGPFGAGFTDDQFGGPAPDNAHLTGVILRLNDDGTTPTDNPFFAAGAAFPGQVGANIRKVFSYGIRNSFGMAFDPLSGQLWESENGNNTFDEINRVTPGSNGGWIQVMGPLGRVASFKAMELTFGAFLQQRRWPTARVAATPQLAMSRMYMLPGARYRNPEFSWRFAVPPAGMGFVNSAALGPGFRGDLFVGAATAQTLGGHLFRFQLTADRLHIAPSDPRLADRVADNTAKHDITESESLLIGTNFGAVTDIKTGPNGNVFVVSLSQGAIYEIFRR